MYDVPALVSEPLLLEPLRHAVEDGAVPAFLRSVKIKLTARCNLRCVMCKYGRGLNPGELPGERFADLMDELAALGCRKVHFSGGEVLARSDFEQIAGRAAAAGMKVTLTSNLTLLTRDRARALMRHKISSVSTSLDGATAKTHERVRGVPGAFQRTLRGMRYIARERERRGQRTRVRVNFVMMRQNFRDHPALVRLAAEHGATELHPMPVDSKRPELRLSKRLIREYNEEIAPEVRAARAEVGFSTEAPFIYPFGQDRLHVLESVEGRYAGGYYAKHLCYAPYTHMFVAWDGNVYLCCMTNGRIEPLGNVGTQSAAEVFGGEKFQAIRRGMEAARLPTCHACDMYLGENEAIARALGQEPAQAPSSSVA
ncbi:MAG: radical SAM protein [Deltaproteobacteria bacterium]|nr:radical SAM protein [Deltaproteobacteria bacterium]